MNYSTACPDWQRRILGGESWKQWRDENPEEVKRLTEQLASPAPLKVVK